MIDNHQRYWGHANLIHAKHTQRPLPKSQFLNVLLVGPLRLEGSLDPTENSVHTCSSTFFDLKPSTTRAYNAEYSYLPAGFLPRSP